MAVPIGGKAFRIPGAGLLAAVGRISSPLQLAVPVEAQPPRFLRASAMQPIGGAVRPLGRPGVLPCGESYRLEEESGSGPAVGLPVNFW